MTTQPFAARPPKSTETRALRQLKREEGLRILGAKAIGHGWIKLLVDGSVNYNVSDSPDLRSWLWDQFHLEP